MDGARDQVLAHAAFSAQQHGGIGGGNALHRRQHFLHLRAVGNDVAKLVALAQRFAQRAVLLAQAMNVQFLAEDELDFLHAEGLQHIVAGARFHGLDGRLDGAETPS